MENNGFEHFSDIWKKADKVGLTQKTYSEEQIKNIKMKTSKDFSKTINNSIVFDYVHKSILIAGMLLLIWFYRMNIGLLVTLVSLVAVTILFIVKELKIQNRLRQTNDYTKELTEVVKLKLKFFKEIITPLKLMLAFTNALLVWVGSMFYFYSKYGYYRIDGIDDKIVAFLSIAIAFGGSYLISNWQLNVKVLELEEVLDSLDNRQAATLQLQLRERKKSVKNS